MKYLITIYLLVIALVSFSQDVNAEKIFLRNKLHKYTLNEENKAELFIESIEGDYEINTFTDLTLTIWHGQFNAFVGKILSVEEFPTGTAYKVMDNYGAIATIESHNDGQILFLYKGYITYYINI